MHGRVWRGDFIRQGWFGKKFGFRSAFGANIGSNTPRLTAGHIFFGKRML